MTHFPLPKDSWSFKSQSACSRGPTRNILQYCRNRQLWGDQRQQLPQEPRCFRLEDLVSQEVLRSGTVFLGFLPGAQWVLSYIAETDPQHELPPLYLYRLQWWSFVPGQPLHLVRETALFGGVGVEPELEIVFSQWSCDPTCVLVAGHSCVPPRQCRHDNDLWYVSLVGMPGRSEDILHATYQCPSGAQALPRLLCKGLLFLPVGPDLMLLKTDQSQGFPTSDFDPSNDWCSAGLREVETCSALLSLSTTSAAEYATVLDLNWLSDYLAKKVCAEHNLTYKELLDYQAYAVPGASQGTQASLMLMFLMRAFCSPAIPDHPGGRTNFFYTVTARLQWDLKTGLYYLEAIGRPSRLWPNTKHVPMPPVWAMLLGACWKMSNKAVLQGEPLTVLRYGPWSVSLT